MTLQDLHDQLAPHFPAYAQKDVQTAVRVLAKALQCPDPQHCLFDHFNRPLAALYRAVETSLLEQGKSLHTIRNTKNNLSRFFRLAEAQHLFSLAPAPLTRQFSLEDKGARPGAPQYQASRLPYQQWPLDVQNAFEAFAAWATLPVVPGRPASLRKRPTTLRQYHHDFETYFGFLSHIHRLSTISFDMLFDFSLLSAFVHWHVNDCHGRTTPAIHIFLKNILALTRQYRPLPELRAQLLALRHTLPQPIPTYNKEDAWVSLATLTDIGRALWPRKQPQDLQRPHLKHPGHHNAIRAGLSLMLRLWTYIPYRQRNMREMQLHKHLHKDSQGLWRITFHGEDLKIAVKRGRPNVFDLPFPENLVPDLEAYLALWRPILLAKASQPSPYVFLTLHGKPYQGRVLSEATKRAIYRYTGKHWHPHIIRTVWATEWIRKTHGDFYTAAIMLNDKLETVIANYAHLLEEDVAEKAYRLIEERNGQSK
jgi:hypothetical protein